MLDNLPTEEVRKLFCSMTGKKSRGARDTVLEGIRRVLDDPARMRTLVEELPDVGRRALELCCIARTGIYEHVLEEEVACALGAEQGALGLVSISQRGLLIRSAAQRPYYGQRVQSYLGTYPELADALMPLLDAWHADGRNHADRVHPEPSRGIRFVSLVLLAHIANARPRVKADVPVMYKRDQDDLRQRFANADAHDIDWSVGFLSRTHLISIGTSRRLELDTAKATATLSLPRRQLARWFIDQRLSWLSRQVRAGIAWLVRRPFWHPADTVEQVFRLTAHGHVGAERRHWALPASSIAYDAERALEAAIQSGLVLRAEDGRIAAHPELLWVLDAAVDSEEPVPATCHVQPNFEVIVPPEAPPAAVLAVGRACRLVRFDTVATFALTRESVRQAVMLGQSADQIVRGLESVAAHGVPANVAQGIRDFAAGVRRGHVFYGVTVIVPDADAKTTADLAASGFVATDLDGVFTGAYHDPAKVFRKLEKQGIAIAGSSESDPAPEAADAQCVAALEHDVAAAVQANHVPPPGPAPEPDMALLAKKEPKPTGSLGELLQNAASTTGFAVDELRLLLAASRVATDTWLDHFPPAIRDILDDLRGPAADGAQARLLSDPGLLELVYQHATQGFADCDCILLGPDTADLALEESYDLLIVQPGQEPLQLTPHELGVRGKQLYVTGHLAGDGEQRAFILGPGTRIALGPETSAEDVRRVP